MNGVSKNLSPRMKNIVESKLAEVGLDYTDFMMELEDAIKKELENEKQSSGVDRVRDWDEFSNYMHKYIEDKTVDKYGKKTGIDLMAVTDPDKCIWNVMKYVFRLYNGQGKRYDLEKIIHYAQMGITLSEGDLTQCGVKEKENPNKKFWLE